MHVGQGRERERERERETSFSVRWLCVRQCGQAGQSATHATYGAKLREGGTMATCRISPLSCATIISSCERIECEREREGEKERDRHRSQNPIQNPIQKPIQNPIQNPIQKPIQKPIQTARLPCHHANEYRLTVMSSCDCDVIMHDCNVIMRDYHVRQTDRQTYGQTNR